MFPPARSPRGQKCAMHKARMGSKKRPFLRSKNVTNLGDSPNYGPVVQLVRTLACHARGQGFESPSGRHFASVAQLVEQGTENPRVVGSIPTGGTIRGFSSFGRAPPCQGGGGGFEPRNPLQ